MANEKKINLVAADMGYGHQRAAYPLFDLSGRELITANNYPGILEWETRYWEKSLSTYEKISHLKKVPILGAGVFAIMDYFQKINETRTTVIIVTHDENIAARCRRIIHYRKRKNN